MPVGAARYRHLMGQVVTIAPKSTRDRYGEISYGTAATYRARVEQTTKLVRSFSGEEVVATHVIYLDSSPIIDPLSQVTLSTGFVGSTEPNRLQPELVAVDRNPGRDGAPHHTVLYLAMRGGGSV